MMDIEYSSLLSKLGELIFEFSKDSLKAKWEKVQIEDTVKNHFERWAKNREMVPLSEELDLGGIEQYIEEGFLQELYACCAETELKRKDQLYKNILDKLYCYSKANNAAKKYYVRQFAETAKGIIENIACHYVDPNTRIVISRAITDNSNKMDTPLFSEYHKQSTLEESVRIQKRRINNQPLISSMPERLSFGALFEPGDKERALFIEQPISMLKSSKHFNGVKELFNEKKEENLVVTGSAGSGKTTGLKALFVANHSETVVFYTSVKELINQKRNRSEMLHVIREILDGRLSSEGNLILLDGLDEAYPNHPSDAIIFIKSVLQHNAHIWVGCRSDYYSQIAASIQEEFDDVALMDEWNEEMSNRFMTNYAYKTHDLDIKERIESQRRTSSIKGFILSNPFFLTLYLFSIDKSSLTDTPKTEYELLSLFLDRWLETEKVKGATSINQEEFYQELYGIANQLYVGEEPSIDSIDKAVQGLIIRKRTRVTSFLHWDFCVFLISRQIIEATLKGDCSIVDYYPQAFLNDVTDMTWEQLNNSSPILIQKMYRNLFDVYRQIYEPETVILSQQARKHLKSLDKMHILKLKDEIIYFTLRLPDVDKASFFEYASDPNRIDHPIIELGLAYGIGMTRSHPFALAFAQKLRPNSKQDILNRSWTVVFFGDQSALNIYDFEENPVASWDGARNERINRLQENSEKAYRFRLFDIPLLYCFYVSRDWTGCISLEDLEVIKKCDIEWPFYNDQERIFLREQKKKLVDDYELFLEYQNCFS